MSNQRVRDCVVGQWGSGVPPTVPVFTWCDVRDVALAHVRALTRPGAGGQRFYVVGGYFTNTRIADIVGRAHPRLVQEGKVPKVEQRAKEEGKEGEGAVRLVGDDLPEDVYQFDNSRSRAVLGLEYRDLETSIRDTASAILERLPAS